MAWYRTGTVTIVAGQTVVTGTGTNFPANSRVGDEFQGPDGRGYEIVNVTSETVLSILPPYMGPSVAGAAYGIKPINGYAKDLLDRINNLLLDFGGTLALFGRATDAPTLRANISAAASGGNSDITALYGLTTALSVGQGGTGGKTQPQARAGLGLKGAAIAELIGTVAQYQGVAIGDVFEKGSNANGEYTKFADGTMICRKKETYPGIAITQPSGAIFYSTAAAPATYPAPFAETPAIAQYFEATGAVCWSAPTGLSNSTAWTGVYPFSEISRPNATVTLHRIAIGRWFI